jgi:hypothetical protein
MDSGGAHFVRNSDPPSGGCLVEGAARGDMTKSIQVVRPAA